MTKTQRIIAHAFLLAFVLGTLLITGANAAHASTKPRATLPVTLKECVHEDDVNCTWHAKRHGNHKGRDFTAIRSGANVWVFYADGSVQVFPY